MRTKMIKYSKKNNGWVVSHKAPMIFHKLAVALTFIGAIKLAFKVWFNGGEIKSIGVGKQRIKD